MAKGQANYETLSEEGERLFFLLKVKCPVIARDVGAPVGSIVLKRGSGDGNEIFGESDAVKCQIRNKPLFGCY